MIVGDVENRREEVFETAAKTAAQIEPRRKSGPRLLREVGSGLGSPALPSRKLRVHFTVVVRQGAPAGLAERPIGWRDKNVGRPIGVHGRGS